MSRGARPAEVNYYIDADLLGLARVLGRLRFDVTYPGDPGAEIYRRTRPACPVTTPDVLDSVWIPEATRRKWLIITRDQQIQHHRAEIGAVRTYGARMVVLAGAEVRSTFQQLEVVMCQWRKIEGLLREDGKIESGDRAVDLHCTRAPRGLHATSLPTDQKVGNSNLFGRTRSNDS